MRLLLTIAVALGGCAVPAGSDAPSAGTDSDAHTDPDTGPGTVDGDDDGPTDPDPGTDPDPDPTSPAPCELSAIGEAVHAAVLESNSADSLVPMSQLLTFYNDAGEALVEGPEVFPTLADLIARAEHDVSFATFVWEVGSDPSNALLDGLGRLEARLRAEGTRETPVTVRFLVYANRLMGARGVGEPLVLAVRNLDLDPRYVEVDVATRESWGLGAMHQKVVVIDGEIVHVGGANVEFVHGWEDGLVPWHDSAYIARGEIAHAMLLSFDDMWIEGRTWECDGSVCNTELNRRPARTLRTPIHADGCLPMLALTRRPRGEINNRVDNAQDQGWLAAMGAATEVIKIESPNLNDNAAKDAILDALERGVNVRIVLSLGFNERTESLPGVGGGNAANADELYARATEAIGAAEACRLLQIRWYARDASGPIEGNGAGASHTKYMSVDDQMVIVGSGNMDTVSWNNAGEVNLAVDDAEVTAEWNGRMFDADFARSFASGHCGSAG